MIKLCSLTLKIDNAYINKKEEDRYYIFLKG